MWLSFALVYSLLFGSAVLAGYPSGKRRLPPLHRGERSINKRGTEVFEWSGAGAMLESDNTLVAGTVTLPPAQGYDGSTLIMAVGMGGLTCGNITLGGGITVVMVNNVTTYLAWVNYYDNFFTYTGADITLSVGHPIRITAKAHNPTSGTVTLQNIATGQTVSHDFQGSTPLCMQDADWVVLLPVDSDVPLPNFGIITFTGMEIDGNQRPKSEDLFSEDIAENGDLATFSSVAEQFVVTQFNPNRPYCCIS